MGYIGKYFTELFRGWTVAMSTVASLIFLFLPLLFPNTFKDSSAVPASYIWVMAALCFCVSGYQVWRREHRLVEARDGEIARFSAGKALPAIKGSAFHFQFNGVIGTGHEKGKWRVHSAVLFTIYLCNHNAQETNLQELKLDGSELEPPIEFGPVIMNSAGGCPALPSGKGVTVSHVQVAATIYDFRNKEDVPIVSLDKLRISAVDGFLQEHPIDMKNEETLRFW